MDRVTRNAGRLVALAISAGLLVAPAPAGTEWTRADHEMVRVRPARFGALPAPIRSELDRRGCTIPQPFTADTEHLENAIRGRFVSRASADWAVLCSRNRRSAILVFRSGDVSTIDEIGAEDDVTRLQVTGPGRIGYSRRISAVRARELRELDRSRDPGLPMPDHDGIQDAFIEKGSIVWYWSGRRWLRIAGEGASASPGRGSAGRR